LQTEIEFYEKTCKKSLMKVSLPGDVTIKAAELKKVTEEEEDDIEMDFDSSENVSVQFSDSNAEDDDFEEEEEESVREEDLEGGEEEEDESTVADNQSDTESLASEVPKTPQDERKTNKSGRRPLSALGLERQKKYYGELDQYVPMGIFNPEPPMYCDKKDKEGKDNESVNVKFTVTAARMNLIYENTGGFARYGDKKGQKIKYQLKKSYGASKNIGYYGVAAGRPAKFKCNVVGRSKGGKITFRCKEEFDTLFQWRKHLFLPTTQGGHGVKNHKSSPACGYCCALYPPSSEMSGSKKDCLQKHLPCEPLKSPNGEKDLVFYCVFCLSAQVNPELVLFDDILKYRDHQAIYHEEDFPSLFYCGICGEEHTKDTARGNCQKACLEKEKVEFICRLCTNWKRFSSVVEKAKHYEAEHEEFMHQCFLVNVGGKPHTDPKRVLPHCPRYVIKYRKEDGKLKCPFGCGFIVDSEVDKSYWVSMWPHVKDNHDQNKRLAFVNRNVPVNQKANFNPA